MMASESEFSSEFESEHEVIVDCICADNVDAARAAFTISTGAFDDSMLSGMLSAAIICLSSPAMVSLLLYEIGIKPSLAHIRGALYRGNMEVFQLLLHACDGDVEQLARECPSERLSDEVLIREYRKLKSARVIQAAWRVRDRHRKQAARVICAFALHILYRPGGRMAVRVAERFKRAVAQHAVTELLAAEKTS